MLSLGVESTPPLCFSRSLPQASDWVRPRRRPWQDAGGGRRTARVDSCFPWLFLCAVTRGQSVPPLESTVSSHGSYSRHPFLVLPLPLDTPPLTLVSEPLPLRHSGPRVRCYSTLLPEHSLAALPICPALPRFLRSTCHLFAARILMEPPALFQAPPPPSLHTHSQRGPRGVGFS